MTKFKNLPLKNRWANLNQTWYNASLGEEDSVLKKRPHPFPKGDYIKIAKNTLTKLKISSSQEPLGKFEPNLVQRLAR